MASKTPKKVGKAPARGSAIREADAPRSRGRKPKDVVLVHGITDDGKGYKVLRQRDERIEAGSLRPVEDGKPLAGDLVQLTQRAESPLLFDVSVEHAREGTDPRAPSLATGREQPEGGRREADGTAANKDTAARKGPAQVVSPAYRSNWTRIWGTRSKKPLLN